MNLDTILLIIYLTGFGLTLRYSIKALRGLARIDPDILVQRPDIKLYALIKPILWPIYLFIEKHPLVFISELFFKHYGEKGHVYFGDRGIKNFFNNVFKGKKRYEHCKVTTLYWPLDKDVHHDFSFLDNQAYAKIVFTKIKDSHLLGITIAKEKRPETPISRFELDQCRRLDESTFKETLSKINVILAKELFEELGLKSSI